VDLAVSSGNDLFQSDVYDTLVILTYQMLFIILTFGLFLMVNRRLVADLERDIAKRERADEALKQSEEKFYKAFHASPDGILITRASDGRLVEVNEGFCRLTGYSREEALASTTIALSVWADPLDRDRCISALRDKQSIHDYEYDFRTKSGNILNCLYSGEIMYLGNEAHVLSVVRDSTERKRTEAALRRSEADFREVFDSTAHGIFIIDVLEDGKFRIGNSNKAEEIATTIRREDVQGKLLEDAFPADIAQVLHADYSRCLEAGAPIAYEEEINLPAGRRFYHTALAPVRDESGRFYRIIGSTLDITESKQVEELMRLRCACSSLPRRFRLAADAKSTDEICEITNSPIGFFHVVEADQITLLLQAWSTRTLNEFCHAEGQDCTTASTRLASGWIVSTNEDLSSTTIILRCPTARDYPPAMLPSFVSGGTHATGRTRRVHPRGRKQAIQLRRARCRTRLLHCRCGLDNYRAQTPGGRCAPGQRGGRSRQPRQDAVPCEHEPRAAHAA
jgi:PAS domain S-box-containing protein